jgi:hypothetical protein
MGIDDKTVISEHISVHPSCFSAVISTLAESQFCLIALAQYPRVNPKMPDSYSIAGQKSRANRLSRGKCEHQEPFKSTMTECLGPLGFLGESATMALAHFKMAKAPTNIERF